MTQRPRHHTRVWGLVIWLGWTIVASGAEVTAACLVEGSVSQAGGALVKKLPSSCTQAERELHAVDGASILESLKTGQPVDLTGVIVRGDVDFGRLSAQTVGGGTRIRSDQPEQTGTQEVRLVRGPLTIRESVVLGAVRHRSSTGTLRFEGPVDFHGTTFKDGVDLSRAHFQGPVELAEAVFQKEAYFVQGRFMQGLGCQGTRFGPHTRFHRSIFRGAVDCTGALFDGTAEWLEVTFEQPAVFERTRFGSGTGFSGSHFIQQVAFTDAIFSRDTFFTFSVFEEEAVFAGGQFLGSVDFSDADFKKPDDLARARFDQPPRLTRTRRVIQEQPGDDLVMFFRRYGLTAMLLLASAGLVGYILKSK
ncbi:MAG: pentapeptide repeat-containing protein [Nitrospira sp.]|nr:pentapeptide repeat-containing protein [Nitrospira sp.]